MENKQKMPGLKKINLLISLLIAFVAWVYVVYNFTPNKDVTYHSVQIEFEGEDVLANNGLAVEKANIEEVDVVVNQRRADTSVITAEDIHVIADVSELVMGDNGVSLSVETPDGVSFESISTSSISVSVGKSRTKDVPVVPVFTDAIEAGTEPISKSMSYQNVSIFGVADSVNKVEYVSLQFSVTELGNRMRYFVKKPVAMDKNGRIVSHIVVLPSEIGLYAKTGVTKTVKLSIQVKDNPDGLKYELQSSVVIKGPKSVVAEIDSIEAEDVSLSGIKSDTELNIEYKLPDQVSIARESIASRIVVKATE